MKETMKMKYLHAIVGVVFLLTGVGLIIWNLFDPMDPTTSSVYLGRLLSGVGVLALSLIPFSLATRCCAIERLREAEEQGRKLAKEIQNDGSRDEVYKQISLALLNVEKRE